MTLPPETIMAVAGIVAGVTGLSWLAYEWAPLIFERPGEPDASDWSTSAWGDVAELPSDLKAVFHSASVTEERQRNHAA